jgi:hypothetical protein
MKVPVGDSFLSVTANDRLEPVYDDCSEPPDVLQTNEGGDGYTLLRQSRIS